MRISWNRGYRIDEMKRIKKRVELGKILGDDDVAVKSMGGDDLYSSVLLSSRGSVIVGNWLHVAYSSN